jgi:DNA-directed RNA polymerase subunit RPC12/RpoP
MRDEICVECGVTFSRPVGRKLFRCFDCGMKRVVTNVVAQKVRSGETYERTVRSQYIHWRDEKKRLGIRV